MTQFTPLSTQLQNDQAASLRTLVADRQQNQEPARISGLRSLAVLSGKGGVGKTNIAVNLAIAFSEMGMRVVLLDADLGLANLDVLFGVAPKLNLGHVLRGECEIADVLLEVYPNVFLIPGGSGLRELADLDDQKQAWFIEKLSSLEEKTDILILDTGAGIHRSVLSFALAADRTLLVTVPEPTAIRDSYSVLKSLHQLTKGGLNVGLVVNMAVDKEEGYSVAERIREAAQHFLDFSLPSWGCILWDDTVRSSVRQRKPFLLYNRDAEASQSIRSLASKLLGRPADGEKPASWGRGLKTFLFRLVRQLNTKG